MDSDTEMDTSLSAEEVSRKLKERLGFEPHDWQLEAVQHTLAGTDTMITGIASAGKTTCFLAAATLMEKGDVALVVCPSDEPGHSVRVSEGEEELSHPCALPDALARRSKRHERWA